METWQFLTAQGVTLVVALIAFLAVVRGAKEQVVQAIYRQGRMAWIEKMQALISDFLALKLDSFIGGIHQERHKENLVEAIEMGTKIVDWEAKALRAHGEIKIMLDQRNPTHENLDKKMHWLDEQKTQEEFTRAHLETIDAARAVIELERDKISA